MPLGSLDQPLVLRVLEPCSGPGGLSFMAGLYDFSASGLVGATQHMADQAETPDRTTAAGAPVTDPMVAPQEGRALRIESRWAVDTCPAACATWQAAHPEGVAWNMRADEFSCLCKMWSCIIAFLTGAGGQPAVKGQRRGESFEFGSQQLPGANQNVETQQIGPVRPPPWPLSDHRVTIGRRWEEAGGDIGPATEGICGRALPFRPGEANPRGRRRQQGPPPGYRGSSGSGGQRRCQGALAAAQGVVVSGAARDGPLEGSSLPRGNLRTARQPTRQVQLRDSSSGATEWVTLDATRALELRSELLAYRDRGDIPQPGDVQIIASGPPCQGVSAANLHRAEGSIADIMAARKNNVLFQVLEQVGWFR